MRISTLGQSPILLGYLTLVVDDHLRLDGQFFGRRPSENFRSGHVEVGKVTRGLIALRLHQVVWVLRDRKVLGALEEIAQGSTTSTSESMNMIFLYCVSFSSSSLSAVGTHLPI